MTHFPFDKMHVCGNDFMLVSCLEHDRQFDTAKIQQLADRHKGVGFDQLLLLKPPTDAHCDFDYQVFNADGSEAEQCGNGSCALMAFIKARGYADRNEVVVNIQGRQVTLLQKSKRKFTADMGVANFAWHSLPFTPVNIEHNDTEVLQTFFDEEVGNIYCLNLGNPHAVLITQDLSDATILPLKDQLLQKNYFPSGANIEFVKVQSSTQIQIRVFERGAGETLACGSGACASVIVLQQLKKVNSQVDVIFTGGSVHVSRALKLPNAKVQLTAEPHFVFQGNLYHD